MEIVRVKGVASSVLSRGLDGEGSSYPAAFGIGHLLSRPLSTWSVRYLVHEKVLGDAIVSSFRRL